MRRRNRPGYNNELRLSLALTQEKMADWVGVPRATLSLVEAGRQHLPSQANLRENRLLLASLGKKQEPDWTATDAPPPLSEPPLAPEPLRERVEDLEHRIRQLEYAQRQLLKRAAPYYLRLRVIPALRAAPAVEPRPGFIPEDRWLEWFEGDTFAALRDTYGAGPQALLAARLVGLRAELAALQAVLGAHTVTPAAPVSSGS